MGGRGRISKQDAENVALLTRPTLVRQDTPFTMRRSQSPIFLQRTPGDGAVLAARGGRVKKKYASVAELPAALLGCHFEHPAFGRGSVYAHN